MTYFLQITQNEMSELESIIERWSEPSYTNTPQERLVAAGMLPTLLQLKAVCQVPEVPDATLPSEWQEALPRDDMTLEPLYGAIAQDDSYTPYVPTGFNPGTQEVTDVEVVPGQLGNFVQDGEGISMEVTKSQRINIPLGFQTSESYDPEGYYEPGVPE